MYKQYLLWTLGLLFFGLVSVQAQTTMPDRYAKDWKTIDSLERQGLFRSALDQTENLLRRLRRQNQTDHIIRGLVYRARYSRELNENGEALAIQQLEEELTAASGAEKAVMSSVLAEVYRSYLEMNRWQINRRTQVSADEAADNIETWSVADFYAKISALYLSSLEESSLKTTRIGEWSAIIDGGENTADLRPTLYDFLAFRVIEYFSTGEAGLIEPSFGFQLDSPLAFADAETFAAHEFKTSNPNSNLAKALRIYQDLLSFRINQSASLAALIDADILRLQFVKQYSNLEGPDQLYRKALEDLRAKYKGQTLEAKIIVALADFFYDKGASFNPENGQDDSKQFYWQYAHDLYQEIEYQNFSSVEGQLATAKRAEIRNKELNLRVEQVYLPNQAGLFRVEYRNIDKVYWRMVKLTRDQMHWANNQNDLSNELRNSRILNQGEQALSLPRDYRQHSTELFFDAMPLGFYAILLSDKADFSEGSSFAFQGFTISRLGPLVLAPHKDRPATVMVADRETGVPLPGVEVIAYDSRNPGKKNIVGRTRTDGSGRASFEELNQRSYAQLFFRFGEDQLFSRDYVYGYNYRDNRRPRQSTEFFLDRGIYRPGQTLYFKALALEYSKDDLPSVLTNQEITIMLRDVNGQEVDQLTLRTNEFGTVNGTFVLPKGRLTGRMSLMSSVGGNYQAVQVEEYKRPRFEVEMEDLAGRPKLGDEVEVSGKALAYAGPALQGATVRYNISMQLRLPWWYRSYYPGNQEKVIVKAGETSTDDQGVFSINFRSIKPLDRADRSWWSPIYEYVVAVDVTDVTGETHATEKRIVLTKTGLSLSIDGQEEVDRQAGVKLGFSAKNADGKEVDFNAKVTINRLDHPKQTYIDRYWSKPDQPTISEAVFRVNFPNFAFGEEDQKINWPSLGTQFQQDISNTSSQLEINSQSWPVGVYEIQFVTDEGEKVSQYLSLFDEAARIPPVGKILWLKQRNITEEVGNKLDLSIATSAQTLIADLFLNNRDGMRDQHWLNASTFGRYSIEIKEDDRGGIYGTINALRFNRRFQEQVQIQVPWSNKELSVRYETFRDKLRPGEPEEWRIIIDGPQGDRVGAEVLATMYDASLDQLLNYQWRFSPYPLSRGIASWQANSFQSLYAYGQVTNLIKPRPRIIYPSFTNINMNWGGRFGRMAFDGVTEMAMARSAAPPPAPGEANAPVAYAAKDAGVAEAEPIDEGQDNQDGQSSVSIRKNLEETAFFFPEIRTDAQGRIVLAFDSPESLTRWNFRLFSHTPDLAYVLDSREVVTQKELMILPNAPRFMREGDELYFTAKVSNLSGKTLTGNARLELFDATNMQSVNSKMGLTDNTIPFKLETEQSEGVNWKITVPSASAGALVYRVIAEAENFSDGEESLLPILTNRTMVTAAIPLHVGGKQNKNFELEPLVNMPQGASPQQVRLQITSNPAWLAVKALPYLMEYPYNCTEQLVNRFYANSLATNVVQQYPQMRQVFDAWKANGQALESPLAKNQELASILLEETPWLRESMDEEEQRERIALLFDLDRMADEQQAALEDLINRQQGDGGFSWFPGGNTNWYMTQYVLENLLRLIDLGVWQGQQPDGDVSRLMQNGIRYIDQQALEHYRKIEERVAEGLTKWEDDHLSNTIIHYLYVKSLVVGASTNDAMAEAQLYYLDQADKYWVDKSLFSQAMLALALNRSGRAASAKAIFRSLQERALQSEELGMYWKYPRGFYWHQLPIETHVMLMEVFKEMGGTAQELNDLKVWLLKNKETNRWETTKATSAAVYGLLSTGDDWLGESELVQVSFPKTNKSNYEERLSKAQASAEAGTGFYETQWEADEINPGLGIVRLKNKNKTIAWGGLYFQYFQDIDQIKKFADSPLKIDRKLFRRNFDDQGESLVELTANEDLKPGQRLTVRLIVETDRDMEYVHLKDLRASGMEPTEVLSGYRYQDALGYYQSITDIGVNFFFDYLPKGTYVLEYDLFVNHQGDFSSGLATLQCMYAPAFSAYSEGRRVKVD